MSKDQKVSTTGMVSYVCPVCGEVDHADAQDALVTCFKGHHLTLSSFPDEKGFVSAEVIPSDEEE